MSLTAAEVAVLCDVGQAVALSDARQGEVEKLIQQGYLTRVGPLYGLTPMGEKELAERGVGLNEA